MKFFISTLIIFTFWAQTAYSEPIKPRVKYVRPAECSKADHTCVLKVDDGRKYFCLRLFRQRQRNSRVQGRTIQKRSCIKRFTAVPIAQKEQPSDK